VDNPYQLPPGFNDKPINVDAHPFIPNEQLHAIQPHIPQLNLNPPAQQQSGSGDALKMGMDVAKMAMMFANRGGRIDPKKFDGANPYAFADGGATFDERFSALKDGDVVNPDEPYRMPDRAAVDDWRKGADTAMAFAQPDRNTSALPRAVTTGRAAAAPTREDAEDVNPYSPPSASPAEAVPEREHKDRGFAASPWRL
jgi:hypothetical protein